MNWLFETTVLTNSNWGWILGAILILCGLCKIAGIKSLIPFRWEK